MPSAVRLQVISREIATYVLGPDSPYPAMPWQRWRGPYPYSIRLDLSSERRPVNHRIVVLENECLRAEVLPDMGGRLYRLYDKTARQETFMVPPTVKFQNVALRGAWVAGGIEWNFGQPGHTVNTVNPVSWTLRRGPDGSAAVHVGTVVRPMESRWSVRIGLRPGRSVLDVDIQTVGPLTLPGSMYWWTNSAVEVSDQSKFFYYGLYAGDYAPHSWPMTDGLDFRWYRNRILKADMFLMEPQRDYLAFYDFARKHGLASTANRFEAPGQKYFTWGADMRGKYWDLQLSDSEQTYVEIQRGRLPTQGKTELIPPMSADTWHESWMPLNDTAGFEHLENELALAVVPSCREARQVRLLSAVARRDLVVEAFDGQNRVGRWRIGAMQPGAPVGLALKGRKAVRCNRVRVVDASGAVLMDWTELVFKDEDWTKTRPGFEESKASLEELFEEAQRRRSYFWPASQPDVQALYERILKMDAGHSGASQALAEADLFNGLFDKALERVDLALKRRPLDPSLQALRGWTLLRLNRPADAVGAFTTAARYEPGRQSGLIGLAWARLLESVGEASTSSAARTGATRAARPGKPCSLAAAEQTIDRLLADRPNDRWGRWLKCVLLRRRGQQTQAAQVVKTLLASDPLWSAANAEAALLGLPPHLADGKRRLADDSVTAALPYLDLRLWDDAQRLLRIDESDEAFSPMVRLAHLAYAQLKSSDRAAAKTIQQLRQAPLEQASPWATTSLVVLSELVKAFDKEGRLLVMLGNVLANRYRLGEAVSSWKMAIELGTDHAVVHACLASVENHQKRPELAMKHYARAWELSGGDVNLFTEYDRLLSRRGLHRQRDRLYRQLPPETHRRSIVALRRVPQLLDLQRYDEALKELATRQFLSGEAAEFHIRRNFLEALLGKGVTLMNAGRFAQAHELFKQGLTYPRNHNAGRWWMHPSEAMINFWLGLTAEALGQPDQARQCWLAAAHEAAMEGEVFQAYQMLAWLALGNVPRAVEMSHGFKALAFGEKSPSWWLGLLNTAGMLRLNHGLAQLCKGRPAEAHRMWVKALATEPDARFIRPHINMSRTLLDRMCRRPQLGIHRDPGNPAK